VSGSSRRLLPGAISVALGAVLAALMLPAGAGAGLTEVMLLYGHDPVVIPNGHDAAKMSFDADSSTRTVGAVRPNFRIRHDRTQQLELWLKGPSGDKVLLSDHETQGQNLGHGSCGPDYNSVDFTGFDQSASQGLDAGSAPYAGYWLPNESLSPLTGASHEGRWTLIVKDTNPGGDKGKLLCGLVAISLPP
jgi:hypothetical protein